jgi:hypothetical protein
MISTRHLNAQLMPGRSFLTHGQCAGGDGLMLPWMTRPKSITPLLVG